MTKTSVRTRVLALVAVLLGVVGMVTVVIPATAASVPGEVRLHLGSDGQYFAYGNDRQPLTSSNCTINSDEKLIDLSGLANKAPGLSSNGLGVKSGGSSGTPCGQVDGNEGLRLARAGGTGGILGARQFYKVALDLEMTGNSLVRLTLASATRTVTYQLQTGTSITDVQRRELDYDTTVPYGVISGPGDEVDACAAPNSSGPNSGQNDNCRWTVDPNFNFDTITLQTTGGTVSLEGSGDFGNNPDNDTILYLANSAPIAVDDPDYTTDEDVSLQADVLSGVLSNDSDPDGDTLTAQVAPGGDPLKGSLTLESTGAFTYVPDAESSGIDTFTYTASDGTATTTATATITVTPVNDPPVAASGGATTTEDTLVVITVATDVDSAAITSTCTSNRGGTIEDNGDGTVDFTPPSNFEGTVTLTCTAVDSDGASTTSDFLIVVGVDAVNDAPVANDDTADVDADGSVVIDVLGNDTDVDDGDVLSITDIASVLPTGATAEAIGGKVTYTPPAGYDGPGSFTYKANDGALSSNLAATVDVTVFPVVCTGDTVSTDALLDVNASFTKLSGAIDECKRYTLEASQADESVLFLPTDGPIITWRGVVTFGSDAPPADREVPVQLRIRYDATGGTDFKTMLWCTAPQFDANRDVISATMPAGETWCVASSYTSGDSVGDLVTFWQIYGEDDPRLTR